MFFFFVFVFFFPPSVWEMLYDKFILKMHIVLQKDDILKGHYFMLHIVGLVFAFIIWYPCGFLAKIIVY